MVEQLGIRVLPYIGENNDVCEIDVINKGRIIGSVFAQLKGNSCASLDSIVVDACERGKGVGSLLLTKLVEYMIAEGVTEITGEMKPEYGLHVDETRRFYEKNGFGVDADSKISKVL